MKIIQIEVTNACGHSCSNCTRFCGHFKKPFFMDYDTFVRAVDSMEGFPGMTGIMGGEPTIHPQFEKLMKYYASKTDGGRKYANALKPIRNFSQYLVENDMQNIKSKRGLWSSLGTGYYKNYELIQETFPFQLINDHSHSGLHQTLLVTRKELGIPDDKWIEMRDNCWAQNMWSASITPKGCFFCEVAAALDMLFDGPGGWPIEKGWWKRKPEDFGEQLNWCEFCSAVLNVPRVEAALETDVVSPVIYERLKQIGSPKLNKGKVKIFNVKDYHEDKLECDYSSEWYLPSGDNTKRVSCTNRSLYPKKLCGLLINSNHSCESETLKKTVSHFDKTVIADFTGELKTGDSGGLGNVSVAGCAGMGIDEGVDKAFEELAPDDWIVIAETGTVFSDDFRDVISRWIFNPGCLYCHTPEKSAKSSSETMHEKGAPLASFSDEKHALPYPFMMFNRNAFSLRKKTVKAVFSWPAGKTVMIDGLRSTNPEKRLEQLSIAARQKTETMTKHIMTFWSEQLHACPDTALFGAGSHTKWLLAKLMENNLPMPRVIFDDDPDSGCLNGVKVAHPADYAQFNISVVVVSSDTYAKEMTERAEKIWRNSKVRVINPYSGFSDPRFQK